MRYKDVIPFPQQPGMQQDEITGHWYRTGPEDFDDEWVVITGPENREVGHSVHKTEQEAVIASKKLKLKGYRDARVRML